MDKELEKLINSNEWYYNKLVYYLEIYELKVSELDFKLLLTLYIKDNDIEWILYRMSKYNYSLAEVLVMYITY